MQSGYIVGGACQHALTALHPLQRLVAGALQTAHSFSASAPSHLLSVLPLAPALDPLHDPLDPFDVDT